jgi:hypothetical protein
MGFAIIVIDANLTRDPASGDGGYNPAEPDEDLEGVCCVICFCWNRRTSDSAPTQIESLAAISLE